MNKVDLLALKSRGQKTLLRVGDSVYYSGLDVRINHDYGGQVLTILAIDSIRDIAVCENPLGFQLVGVKAHELKLLR